MGPGRQGSWPGSAISAAAIGAAHEVKCNPPHYHRGHIRAGGGSRTVNGQFEVTAGGQVKVPTSRV